MVQMCRGLCDVRYGRSLGHINGWNRIGLKKCSTCDVNYSYDTSRCMCCTHILRSRVMGDKTRKQTNMDKSLIYKGLVKEV